MSLPPGSVIGIIGGGQLGRMMALAAARMGYRCHIYDPHDAPCAAEVSETFTQGEFTDQHALNAFAATCDVVTYEFENLSVAPLSELSTLRPSTRSLEVAQDRATEKSFIESCDAKVAPWRAINTLDDVREAVSELGLPVVLKTRRYGYDGKGQAWIRSADDIESAWSDIDRQPAIAEAAVPFDAEFSIIIARSPLGEQRWEAIENVHRDGILRRSTVPATDRVAANEAAAAKMASSIAAKLDHIGVLTVEFFALESGPIVNEIAPRVHNSGHWTIEGSLTSQFEQHVRAICDLPLGVADRVRATVSMENLIGRDVDAWAAILAEPGAHLHLYNKGEARNGRKMGHVTRFG